MKELVIVGCGPAGLSAALEAEKKELDYLAVDKDRPLTTFERFPQEKTAMFYPDDVENVSDLELEEIEVGELIEKWRDKTSQIKWEVGEVEDIDEIRDGFQVKTCDQEYDAENVIVAIGVQNEPRHLGVPGEEQDHVFHNECPEKDFEGKSVLVIGGGESAVETAFLLCSKARKVTLSYRRDSIWRPKERVMKKFRSCKAETILNSNLKRVKEKTAVLTVDEEKEVEIEADYVLIFAGTLAPKDFMQKIGVEMPEGDDFTDEVTEPKPGLFLAGDLVSKPSIKMAVNQGCKTVKEIAKRKS